MSADLEQALLSAVRHRRTQEALALIARGAHVNAVAPVTLETPLLLAVETGNKTLIRALVENGADVNYVQQLPGDKETVSLSGGLAGHGFRKCPLTEAYAKEDLYDLSEEIKLLEAHGAKELCDLI